MKANGCVAVIGAGIGGLVATLRLAAAGVPVTLLERAARPGGKMRAVPSPAGPVAAGPTVFTLRPVFDRLFTEAGARLDDRVTIVPEPVIARHRWPDGSCLDLFSDTDRSVAAVAALAGARAAREFRAYDVLARRLFETFEGPVMQTPDPPAMPLSGSPLKWPGLARDVAPGKSLRQRLDGAFADRRLRQLFGRYATYVGGSPAEAPAILALIWRAESAGIWRVAGGLEALAAAVADLAVERGAEIRYATAAERIERDGEGFTLHLSDGTRLAATQVLHAGDPAALARGLLGPDVAGAVASSGIEPRSLSACVWSFAARASALALAHHNVFFAADPDAEFADLAAGRLPRAPTIYVCAQDRGTGVTPPETERFQIIVNAPPLGAFRPSPEEIAACQDRTFRTLQGFGLSFTPPPEPSALTTPAGFDRLFPGSDGSLYGLSPHGLAATRARPRARSRVPGLYLAGGGVHPGPGVPMAALSGRHAAETIMQDRSSTSTSRPTATPGGMSTGSPTTDGTPSRSSAS